MTTSEPSLLQAESLAPTDIGAFEWDASAKTDYLAFSNQDQSVEWARTPVPAAADSAFFPPAWVPVPTRSRLHSGEFEWDFVVDRLAKAQIGVGFMLQWNVGPDWGFFGYLGSSSSAWSYDPSTGDVVRNTQSIEGGLPKFKDQGTGIVTVHLDLPRQAEGSARFSVNGIDSTSIALPKGSVIVPAGCLLKESQKVTLARFRRLG